MARQLNLPTFLDELLASHSLFFGRSALSDKVMQSQFAGIDMEIIRAYRDRWSGGNSSVHISDFPIYASRLEYIHQRMEEWSHLHLFDLWHRPYRNSLGYYALWFGVVFGLLAIVSIALEIAKMRLDAK